MWSGLYGINVVLYKDLVIVLQMTFSEVRGYKAPTLVSHRLVVNYITVHLY